MNPSQHKVLVVGAGFAGLAAVRAIPDRPDIEVTLVDKRNHHLFQALLYQVASAGLNPSEIASPVRAIFRDRKNVRVLMGELSSVDSEARRVTFDQGAMILDYDTLVLAVGGATSYFGNDQWAGHSFGLKSLEEALAIRRRVLLGFEQAEKSENPEERRRLTTMVVIGGGPTGVELSGAFAELRSNVLKWDFRRVDPGEARVVLLEGGQRVLAAFPEELSAAALSDLQALGVEARLGERVLDILPGRVVTDRGTIEAHTVVWAGGISGHPVASGLGFETNRKGQIKVDETLRIPGTSIYCLGDMAEFEQDGAPLPAMAPVAMQQGTACGENVTLEIDGHSPKPFHYVDSGIMATVGRTRGVAYMDGRTYTGFRGWSTWLWHHLLRIVDFQNRVMVCTRWAWAYLAWKWGVRLVYGAEPASDVTLSAERVPDAPR